MRYVKLIDTCGLAIVSMATVYGAVVSSADALVLGGLTVLVYASMLFAPGFGGRLGAAIIIPLMGVFALLFVMHVGEVLAYGIVMVGTIRAAILLWSNVRRPKVPCVY